MIIEALAKIVEDDLHNDVVLRIVGDGPQKETLINLSTELGINDYVIFEGFVPNTKINKYYQNADFFVSMSYSESFGQTLIESMSNMLPVISTKVGGFKDINIHNQTGFLVEHDVEEVKKYMIELIANPHLRIEMGLNARKIIEEKYDWNIISSEYYKIYRNLVLYSGGN